MNDATLRLILAEKFKAGTLRTDMPHALHPSTLQGFEAMSIGTGRGRTCSVCEDTISLTAEGSIEFDYPAGEVLRFHGRCHELWNEERRKLKR
jgi:hypothetical protein